MQYVETEGKIVELPSLFFHKILSKWLSSQDMHRKQRTAIEFLFWERESMHISECLWKATLDVSIVRKCVSRINSNHNKKEEIDLSDKPYSSRCTTAVNENKAKVWGSQYS